MVHVRTYEFLTGIGIDSKRIRFRQLQEQKWLTMPQTAGTVKYSESMDG